MNPDTWLFHQINRLAGAFGPVDTLAQLIVNDYALVALFAIVIGGMWFAGATDEERMQNQRGILFGILGLVLANAIIKIGWGLYFRPRPFAVEEGVTLLFYRPSVSSFPSEPVATFTTLALGMWLVNKKVGWWMIGLTALFGFARVMAGVHYPSDILAGAVLGAFCVYVPFTYFRILNRVAVRVIGAARRLNLA